MIVNTGTGGVQTLLMNFQHFFFPILNTSLSEGDFSLQSHQGDVVLPLLMFGVNLNLGQLVITTIGTS